jgi:hypothetical protein
MSDDKKTNNTNDVNIHIKKGNTFLKKFHWFGTSYKQDIKNALAAYVTAYETAVYQKKYQIAIAVGNLIIENSEKIKKHDNVVLYHDKNAELYATLGKQNYAVIECDNAVRYIELNQSQCDRTGTKTFRFTAKKAAWLEKININKSLECYMDLYNDFFASNYNVNKFKKIELAEKIIELMLENCNNRNDHNKLQALALWTDKCIDDYVNSCIKINVIDKMIVHKFLIDVIDSLVDGLIDNENITKLLDCHIKKFPLFRNTIKCNMLREISLSVQHKNTDLYNDILVKYATIIDSNKGLSKLLYWLKELIESDIDYEYENDYYNDEHDKTCEMDTLIDS